MENSVPELNVSENWYEDIARTIHDQRTRARQYLTDQKKRVQQIEQRLTDQIDRIADQLAIVHTQAEQNTTEASEEAARLIDRAAELDAHDEHLAQLQQELDDRRVELPAPTLTAPMTFMHEGKQYFVMAVGGSGIAGSLVALRLPG